MPPNNGTDEKASAMADLASAITKIDNAWLFPPEPAGVSGFWGLGPLLFIGDQPSTSEWPVCDLGRRLLYGKLLKYGFSDAHLTDFYKKRGESGGLSDWKNVGLPPDWATIHEPVLRSEIRIVDPSRIIAIGDLAYQLIFNFMPDLRPRLVRMMHFAHGIRPGKLFDFEFSLQVAVGLSNPNQRQIVFAHFRQQGLSENFDLHRVHALGASDPGYLSGQCEALYQTLASVCTAFRPWASEKLLRSQLGLRHYLNTCQDPWDVWTFYRPQLVQGGVIREHCFSEV